MIFNMFSKNIGRCQTCIYAKIYIADDGYVDDCSYCMKKDSNFKQLVSFENSISCEDYSLARKRYYLIFGKLTELNRKIKELENNKLK